jgi:glycosyltransferase involved in cell wall biosynthesis
MLIGMDVNLASSRDTGIGSYILHLAPFLCRDGQTQIVGFVPEWSASRIDLTTADGLDIEVVYGSAPVSEGNYDQGYYDRRVLWEQTMLPQHLQDRDIDVFFGPAFMSPLEWSGPIVTTVPDLAFERSDEYNSSASNHYHRSWAPKCARHSTALLALSEFTRRDMQELWGIRDRPISVTHLAPSSRFRPDDHDNARRIVARQLDIRRPFVLAVGGRVSRKNLPRLVRAFASARTRGLPTDAMLVIVANPTADAIAVAGELGLEHDLHFTGFCPDDFLPYLYAGARLLVHPALLEGFGLPPLEAMACETPVAASDGGSIPEVVGDSALLFDPFDVEAIAESMCRLWWDESLRHELIARGRRRVRRYSWDSVANATRRALEFAVDAHR